MRYKVQMIFALVFVLMFQSTGKTQFKEGMHYAGPSIGLSFLGSAFQFGGNYEYGIKINNFDNIGVGGVLRIWSYSESFPGGEWSYSNFLIGAQGNYHFDINLFENIDPYAGIVLAYDGGSVSFKGVENIYSTPSHGGFWFGLQGGVRYWITPQTAITGRVGFGTLSYGALEVGVDFKF